MAKPKTKAYPPAVIETKTGVKVRSKLEKNVADDLTKHGVKYNYEKDKLSYTVPETLHEYTPDFTIPGQEWYLEVKGFLDGENRKRMVYVQKSNPFADIRFVFQRDNPIRKGSKTKYSDWATKNGFMWAIGHVPKEWIV